MKRRYDMAIFSNFLTNIDMTMQFEKQLKETAFYLRNKGVFIVAGAVGSSKKYEEVYDMIDDFILNQEYTNSRFIGDCKKIFSKHKMSYQFGGDRFGNEVKDFIKKQVYFFSSNNPSAITKGSFHEVFIKWIQPDYTSKISWEINVYRKKARPRMFLKPRSNTSHNKVSS